MASSAGRDYGATFTIRFPLISEQRKTRNLTSLKRDAVAISAIELVSLLIHFFPFVGVVIGRVHRSKNNIDIASLEADTSGLKGLFTGIGEPVNHFMLRVK
jgi:hypothetical protein